MVIVNTCGFVDAAKEESIRAILDAAEVAHARGALVAAVGCLVERYRAELAAELPEVDLWCGLDTAPLLAAMEGLAAHSSRARSSDPVRRRERPVSAYVKISDGCDRRCAYCAIPLIKGVYEAEPADRILSAAQAALVAGGREIVLVGQDTSRWEQAGWGGLQRLLAELSGLEPAPLWLRMLYLQPDGVDDALLEALAQHAVPYIDIPLQHASGAVLRRMRRAGDAEAYLALLARVRSMLPGAAVRSTFITGFPGESDDDFEELLAFVRRADLAAAGVFIFDPQEGTAAATMPDQVSFALATERAARLSEALDTTAADYWAGLVGRRVDILVERGTSRTDGEAVGRCALQAPDIDGRTIVRGVKARRGDVIAALVTGSLGYDLEAVGGEA